MKANEIREKFLKFFKEKNHEVVSSDLLVPKADPTLLFTSAGMNQFKDQFLGHNVTYKRASSSQKCLRTADLENVGKTAYHHTFFEMLGNFSFGDYFKKEAIEWGWEFVTKTLGIDKDKIWASVYKDDKESYEIWKKVIGMPDKKIVKLGPKDNFWPSNAPKDGPNGPCGPCSEMFFDWGKDVGCGKKTCDPSCDCGRFVEVWNLVFTQFDRKNDGKLEPLPTKNIDTGMGLERITAVMQGVKTNFETDLFTPIIKEIRKHAEKINTSDVNAIADHLRAATFAICDGVAPSNEERGYVVRKLIRRAYVRSKTNRPFLYNIVPKVVEVMKDAYPELTEKRENISMIIKEEEERFGNALSVAMPILESDIEKAKGKLSGEAIFKMVDTYGIPLEIIELEAKKSKTKLDITSFNKLMEKRRELSRNKSKLEEDIFALNLFAKVKKGETSDKLPLKAKVSFMVKGKKAVDTTKKGDVVELLTKPESSSFYRESGGQVGDRGLVKGSNGEAKIINTIKVDDKVIHVIEVTSGSVSSGDDIIINIDNERNSKIAMNHTATHLLHSALRNVLGEHVHQAGSLVGEDRLRFDFTYGKKMTESEIEKVEKLVNDAIKKEIIVKKNEKTIDEAKSEGAMALFGEKYDSKVTVVTAGSVSKEVCGGTHVNNTKEIELFKIVRESSIASGVRRIEAVTSSCAKKWIEEEKEKLLEKEKQEKKKEEEKKLTNEKFKKIEEGIDSLIDKAEDIKGVKVIIETIDNANIGALRSLADKIGSKEKNSFIVLASEDNGKANLVLSINKDMIKKGMDASNMIKELARLVEGSGGGREDFAQAGGKNPSGIPEALKFAKKLAKENIGGV